MVIVMLELRILSGLQAGARVKLPNGSYRIGQGKECDVVIVGHSVEADALLLAITDDAVVATPSQAGCGFGLNDSVFEPVTLSRGQAFRVGDIWILVDLDDTPWPPMNSWLEAAEAVEAEQMRVAEEGASPVEPNDDEGEESVDPGADDERPLPGRRYGKWLVAGWVCILVCGAGMAYVLTSAPLESPPAQDANAAESAVTPASAPDGPPAASTSPPSASDALAELNALFAEHKLDKYLAATAEEDKIRITGDLDSQQARIFEALLVPFVQKYGDGLVINASFHSPRRYLPFRVKQVVSDSMAHVVTDDGIRIFEGGVYMGYRLVSVKNHKVVFAGERSVELEW
jgi:type III secretion protein D